MARNSENTSLPIWLGVFGLAGYAMYKYKQKGVQQMAQNIKVYISGAKFVGENLEIGLVFLNPNSIDIPVRSVVGNIYVNNVKISRVEFFSLKNIKANSKSVIPIRVVLNYYNLSNELINLVTKQRTGITIQFDGVVNANNIPYPVKIDYKL